MSSEAKKSFIVFLSGLEILSKNKGWRRKKERKRDWLLKRHLLET